MTILFLSLLSLSLFAFFYGFNTGGLKYVDLHFHPYFQGWISLANLIFCSSLAISAHLIYRRLGLVPLRYVPLALCLFGVAIALVGLHVSYCKNCGDVGFCGTAHDYPNAITLLGISISLVFYLASLSGTGDFGHAMAILYHSLLVGFTAITAVLFVSIFYMKLPEPSPYETLTRPNVQGLIFPSVCLFAFSASMDFFRTFKKTKDKVYLHVAIQFAIATLAQSVASYHLLTCYGCDIGECSEFFGLAGIFILLALYTLWYSYSVLVKRGQVQ